VLGADVVDEPPVVVVVQCESMSTDVLSVASKPSGHAACTVNVIVPVTPPGTIEIAEVVPPAPIGLA
jgi:hypothetical protein